MKSKKAISLIVLIITIIVMIILASAIIMSLDNANIFNKAEEAVDKTNAATNKYLSELKLAERELEKIQGASPVTDTNPGELSGKGTTDEPYLIESIEDLVAFSNEVNGGRTFEGETVKLTRLLDFNSDNSYVNPTGNDFGDINGDSNTEVTLKKKLTTGVGFTPIGTYPDDDKETYFKGTFDGDGAEIRNLYINLPDESEIVYAGLFGYAEDANFKNIGVTGKIITKEATTGGIVGMIIGTSTETYISNCYSKTVQSGSIVGGMVGYADGLSAEKAINIQDCYNLGYLTSDFKGPVIGGIVGVSDDCAINRCYNKGNITTTNNISGGINGGIVGNVYEGWIKNSYNEGKIVAANNSYNGGVIGEGVPLKVENIYNSGEIISNASNTAGLFGRILNTCIINNCFNIGETQMFPQVSYNCDSSVTLNKIYYKQSDIAPIGYGTPQGEAPIGMTLSQMKSQSFVDTLNKYITDNSREDLVKWKLGPKGYPVLDM